MSKLLICACAMLLLLAPKAVQADDTKIDISHFTCKKYNKLSALKKDLIVFWLDGYYASVGNDMYTSSKWLDAMRIQIKTFCASNPNKTIWDSQIPKLVMP